MQFSQILKFDEPIFFQNTSRLLPLYISIKFFENPSATEILPISEDKFRGGLRNPCHLKKKF